MLVPYTPPQGAKREEQTVIHPGGGKRWNQNHTRLLLAREARGRTRGSSGGPTPAPGPAAGAPRAAHRTSASRLGWARAGPAPLSPPRYPLAGPGFASPPSPTSARSTAPHAEATALRESGGGRSGGRRARKALGAAPHLRMEKGHAARLGLVLVRAVRHLGVKSLLPLHAGRKRFTLAGRGRSGGRARAPPEATRPPPPSPRGVTPPRPPPRSEGAGPARVRASGAAGAGPRSAARRGQPAAGCGRGRGRRAGRARPGSCAPLAAGRRRRRARECRAPERAAESAGRGGERPRPGPRDPPPAREPRLGLSGSEVDGVAPVDGHAARPARSEGPSALEASGGAAWRSLLHGSQHVLVGLEFTAAPEKWTRSKPARPVCYILTEPGISDLKSFKLNSLKCQANKTTNGFLKRLLGLRERGENCFLEMCWWDNYRKHWSLFLAIKSCKSKPLRGRLSGDDGTRSIGDPDTNLPRVKARSAKDTGRKPAMRGRQAAVEVGRRGTPGEASIPPEKGAWSCFVRFRLPPNESGGSRSAGIRSGLDAVSEAGLGKAEVNQGLDAVWGEDRLGTGYAR